MRKKRLFITFIILLFSFSLTAFGSTNIMHTVKKGDTYYKLSTAYNIDLNILLQQNEQKDTQLYEGDLLYIKSISKTIHLYVDHVEVIPDVNPYLENNRTFVPIRFVSEALHSNVSWNEAQKEVIIESSEKTIILPVGKSYAIINGSRYPLDAPIQIHKNRTFLPIRFISEILGSEVIWDGDTYSININTSVPTATITPSYSQQDLYWLSRIVEAEAGGESYQGKLAVSNVVINRKNHSSFPNTIEGVVFDKNYGIQFTPIKNGTIYNTPSQESIDAAIAALNGENNISTCLYFNNPSKSTSSWIRSTRSFYQAIGHHHFYY